MNRIIIGLLRKRYRGYRETMGLLRNLDEIEKRPEKSSIIGLLRKQYRRYREPIDLLRNLDEIEKRPEKSSKNLAREIMPYEINSGISYYTLPNYEGYITSLDTNQFKYQG